jgi:hypothetical protein
MGNGDGGPGETVRRENVGRRRTGRRAAAAGVAAVYRISDTARMGRGRGEDGDRMGWWCCINETMAGWDGVGAARGNAGRTGAPRGREGKWDRREDGRGNEGLGVGVSGRHCDATQRGLTTSLFASRQHLNLCLVDGRRRDGRAKKMWMKKNKLRMKKRTSKSKESRNETRWFGFGNFICRCDKTTTLEGGQVAGARGGR